MAAPSSDESDRAPHRGAGGLDSTKVFVSDSLPGSPPAVGRRLGDFQLVRVVGQGGMGTVYEAQDLTLNRRVALKVLRWDAGGATVERFVREANIVAQLHHTSIVPIFQVGSEEDVHYYAMQFIEGRTLYQAARQARIEARQAAQWTLQAAEALAHAHQYNVIHRDVKPSNILIERDGRIWLTDFGLARGLDDPTLTAANFAVGTPHYMSPEQASAQRNLDHRTDVYSLGATLYELLTGQPVFSGKSSNELIEAILKTEPEPPRRLNRQISRDLETIVLKCLEKGAGKRYASASALADDLRRFLNKEPIQARPVGRIMRTLRWWWRRPLAAALMASLLVGAMVSVYFAVGRYVANLEAGYASRLADTQQYHARISRAARVLGRPALGCKTQSREDLFLAAEQTEVRDAQELRRLFAVWLSHWDLEPPRTLMPDFDASCLVVSPRADWLGVADAHTTLPPCRVLLLDAESGVALKTIPYLPALQGVFNRSFRGTCSIAVDPTGRWVVVGAHDGSIHYRDVMNETAQWRTISGAHAKRIRRVAFTPDGKSCFSGADDRVIKLWRVPDWKEVKSISTIRGRQAFDGDLAVSPDGKRLAVCTIWATVSFLDIDTLDTESAEVLSHATPAVCFSPSGRMAAAMHLDGTISLIDTARVRVFRSLEDSHIGRAHEDLTTCLQFSPDESLLLSSSVDGTAKIWEVASGHLLLTAIMAEDSPIPSSFSRDGSAVLAAGIPPNAQGGDKAVLRHNLSPPTAQSTIAHHPHPVYALDFSADGKYLGCLTEAEVTIWDALSGKLVSRQELGTPLRKKAAQIAFHPDGTSLAFSQNQGISTLKVADKTIIFHALDYEDGIAALRFSPKGEALFVAVDNAVLAYEGESPHRRDYWVNESEPFSGVKAVRAIAVGEHSLPVCTPRLLRMLHRTAAGTTRFESYPLAGEGACVGMSLDERWVAVGTRLGELQILDVAAKQLRSSVQAHSDRVEALDFSADGRLLATASRDGTVRLWNAGDGSFASLITLSAGDRPVHRVRFNPDGRRLAMVVRGETAVRVWKLDVLQDKLGEVGLRW